MKIKIYLRIAKTPKGFLIAADKKQRVDPLKKSACNYSPTVGIILDLDIPNKEFDKSRILLEAKIEETNPCVEIQQIKPKEENKELKKL